MNVYPQLVKEQSRLAPAKNSVAFGYKQCFNVWWKSLHRFGYTGNCVLRARVKEYLKNRLSLDVMMTSHRVGGNSAKMQKVLIISRGKVAHGKLVANGLLRRVGPVSSLIERRLKFALYCIYLNRSLTK